MLVIGAGMYVGGRGAGTDGTVLPTLMAAQSKGILGDIKIAATRPESIDALRLKLEVLNDRLGLSVDFDGYPKKPGVDPDSYKEALADLQHPACAIVVTPDDSHCSITADVIKAGVHPLVVKPLTPTISEAQELVQLIDQYQVYGAVEFHKRFDETNLLLRQALIDGKLGDVRYITVEYSQKRMMRTVFESWVGRTNIFQYLGVHYVDLIYFLTRYKPLRCLALGQPDRVGTDNYTGLFDSIQVVIEWEESSSGKKFVSTIVTNWIDPDTTTAMSDQKITVVGTEGRYQIDQKNRGANLVTQLNGVEEINPYFSQIYRGPDGELDIHGYGPRCITQFILDVRNVVSGESALSDLLMTRPSFYDCLPSTAVIEAVNQSLEHNGDWVMVQNYSQE